MRKLGAVFPAGTLSAIEGVYENHNQMTSRREVARFLDMASNKWARRDRGVMSAIFRNIIANNGNFKPSTGVHPEIGVKLNKKRQVVAFRKHLRKKRKAKVSA